MTKTFIFLPNLSSVGTLEFGYWALFGVWDLVIGI
jgi:hypothetical protein